MSSLSSELEFVIDLLELVELELRLRSDEYELTLRSVEYELTLRSDEYELTLRSVEYELTLRPVEYELRLRSVEHELTLRSVELEPKLELTLTPTLPSPTQRALSPSKPSSLPFLPSSLLKDTQAQFCRKDKST